MAWRCLIVDDNVSFIAAARTILNGGPLTVVGQAGTAAEAFQRADQLSPDVILLDIDLGGESGLAVARDLVGRPGRAAAHIIVISAHPEDDFADLVAASPALGFIAKSELSAAAIVDLVHRGDADADDQAQRESR